MHHEPAAYHEEAVSHEQAVHHEAACLAAVFPFEAAVLQVSAEDPTASAVCQGQQNQADLQGLVGVQGRIRARERCQEVARPVAEFLRAA